MAEPSRLPPAASADPVLEQFREQITENDRAIVEAINKRLRLVAEIKRHKEAHGLPFLDPAREAWMLRYLSRASRGPLWARAVNMSVALPPRAMTEAPYRMASSSACWRSS